MYHGDKVPNPYRVGLDITTQEDQGEFNSLLIICQLGTGSGAGPSNSDYQYMYFSDKVLNPCRVRLDLTLSKI